MHIVRRPMRKPLRKKMKTVTNRFAKDCAHRSMNKKTKTFTAFGEEKGKPLHTPLSKTTKPLHTGDKYYQGTWYQVCTHRFVTN